MTKNSVKRIGGFPVAVPPTISEDALTLHIEQDTPAEYHETALGALDELGLIPKEEGN